MRFNCFSSVACPKTNVVITIQNDAYGAEEKLPAVEDGANRFDNLLRTEFGFVSPSQILFGRNIFENIKKREQLMKILETVLKRWRKMGETLGRFVLYYHGHGVQVGWTAHFQMIVVFFRLIDAHAF